MLKCVEYYKIENSGFLKKELINFKILQYFSIGSDPWGFCSDHGVRNALLLILNIFSGEFINNFPEAIRKKVRKLKIFSYIFLQ